MNHFNGIDIKHRQAHDPSDEEGQAEAAIAPQDSDNTHIGPLNKGAPGRHALKVYLSSMPRAAPTVAFQMLEQSAKPALQLSAQPGRTLSIVAAVTLA